ncbi:hypothetical protein Ciccas_003932 [Cichlidogyrus casuarinus]|uniref:Nuclear cap-binding protein subunit 3 n=1 Tax=Cichlidogyrus casuarinus TaxID=1844966 RepID=A0ABD2QCX9_9PLAT
MPTMDYDQEENTGPIISYSDEPYCSCMTNYCECIRNSSITKKVAMDIYSHLGFPNGREKLKLNGYRLDTLHIWGTDNLNSQSLMKWLQDYAPKKIEWVNDSSCNMIFDSEETVLRVIFDMSEPFDRDVAAAAALTVVANLVRVRSMQQNSTTPEVVDVEADEFVPELMPSKGSWFKAPCVPEGAIALYLRFAHKTDVKLPGAERRSRYYEKYGNPNAQARNDGRTQAKATRKFNQKAANSGRSLVSYGDLYDDYVDPFEEFLDSSNNGPSTFQRNSNLNYYVELANDDIDRDMITVTQMQPKRSLAGSRHAFRNKADRLVSDGPLKKYPRPGQERVVTLSDRWNEFERETRGYSFKEPGLTLKNNGRLGPTDLAVKDLAQLRLGSGNQANKNHQLLFKAGAFNQRKLLTSMGMIADLVEDESHSANLFNADRLSVHTRLQHDTSHRNRSNNKKSVHNRLF